jgi:hypothetical protein
MQCNIKGRSMRPAETETELSAAQTDRRAFLAAAGKLAVGVPPTVVVLLSTSMSSPAIALSGGAGSGGKLGNPTLSEGGRCWYNCGG